MTEPPKRVTDLFRAITALSKELNTTDRRLVALVGNIALSQMLPDSAIKGGTGLKLRFGERLTRDTPDVDAAFRGDLEEFRDELAEKLAVGWGSFTGAVTMGAKRSPKTVPEAYVMSVPITDPTLVATTAKRLFKFRAEHEWPPTLTQGSDWESLYADAGEGLAVLPTATEAIAWLKGYVDRLDKLS